MENFTPKGYEVPANESMYMKLEEGSNKILPLASMVVGYEYWNKDNKPVRSKEAFKKTPEDIKLDDKGKPSKVKHFWAFPVWNYNAKQVQILQLTQKGIMESINSYVNSDDWGNPIMTYSFTVDRKGSGIETKYTVMANPKKDIDKEITEAWEEAKDNINLDDLFESNSDSDDPVDNF